MTSKSTLFAAAWNAARQGAAKFGGSVRSYFAESLRLAHAFFKSQAAKRAAAFAKVEKTTAQKVITLGALLMSWSGPARKSFAFRFVMDNAVRVDQYGEKTKFSGKQVEIINDLYAKHA